MSRKAWRDAAKQGQARWRNPSLACYLAELRLARERGAGLPTAIEANESPDWRRAAIRSIRSTMDGKLAMSFRSVVSANGTTLNQTRTYVDKKGKSSKSVLVYDHQ